MEIESQTKRLLWDDDMLIAHISGNAEEATTAYNTLIT